MWLFWATFVLIPWSIFYYTVNGFYIDPLYFWYAISQTIWLSGILFLQYRGLFYYSRIT